MPITPELLSPAGTLKNMRYAFAYGADAVYAGQPRYSLRVRNNEFTPENLALGIKEAHALGKKFYVVVNIAPHNAKLKTFLKDLAPIVAMDPDALIMSDPGLIMLVREAFPHIDIHLSVQANAVNWATVKFWQQAGLSRVILSRELSLEEIAEIRQQVPEMELEVFVHGALCMAYSGRCLLSGYINRRDPNQGTCTNACRWQYNVQEAKEDALGNIVHQHQSEIAPVIPEKSAATLGEGQTTERLFMLEEAQRPGEYMSASEDEHGTYIMNSKDLRAVEHIASLTRMGVHSLKIEGRTKSFYYCARTAQVYRRAIDDAVAGKAFDPTLMTTLAGLAHRGYTEGFLRRHQHQAAQNYDYGFSVSDSQQFAGEFTGQRGSGDNQGWAEVDVKNRFCVGDSIEIMTPDGNIHFLIEQMHNKKGQNIDVAPGNGHFVYLPIPLNIGLHFAILLRNLVNSTTRKQYSNA